MPKVKVNDIEMYYEVHGEGTPLLAIRGWGSSSQSWSKPFIKSYSEKYKLIIFDNRGTGNTDKPDTKYSIEGMADDAMGLLDAINIPQAHIMGFSMGGMIAQKIGIKYPEKTLGLVIGCSHPGGLEAVPVPEEAIAMMNMISNLPDDMSREEAQRKLMTLYATPEYVEEYGDMLLKAQLSVTPTPEYVRRRQSEAILGFSSFDELPLIRTPTLVIHGERDDWVPVGNATILAERIPDARLVLLKDSGHAMCARALESSAFKV